MIEFWKSRCDKKVVGVTIGENFCMGLQWPFQISWIEHYFYDGPHKVLHLGPFWFQYSAWGLP